jgi:hypothetical protein
MNSIPMRNLPGLLICGANVAAAAQCALAADEILALGAGVLTGPMAEFAQAGSALLLVGGVVQVWRAR